MKYSNNIKNIKKYIFFNQIATFINSLSTDKIESLKRKFSCKILRYRVTFPFFAQNFAPMTTMTKFGGTNFSRSVKLSINRHCSKPRCSQLSRRKVGSFFSHRGPIYLKIYYERNLEVSIGQGCCNVRCVMNFRG